MKWIVVGRDPFVALLSLAGILTALVSKYVPGAGLPAPAFLLLLVLIIGGSLLVPRLAWQAAHAKFGSDQLAGISIVTSVLLGEYRSITSMRKRRPKGKSRSCGERQRQPRRCSSATASTTHRL